MSILACIRLCSCAECVAAGGPSSSVNSQITQDLFSKALSQPGTVGSSGTTPATLEQVGLGGPASEAASGRHEPQPCDTHVRGEAAQVPAQLHMWQQDVGQTSEFKPMLHKSGAQAPLGHSLQARSEHHVGDQDTRAEPISPHEAPAAMSLPPVPLMPCMTVGTKAAMTQTASTVKHAGTCTLKLSHCDVGALAVSLAPLSAEVGVQVDARDIEEEYFHCSMARAQVALQSSAWIMDL